MTDTNTISPSAAALRVKLCKVQAHLTCAERFLFEAAADDGPNSKLRPLKDAVANVFDGVSKSIDDLPGRTWRT